MVKSIKDHTHPKSTYTRSSDRTLFVAFDFDGTVCEHEYPGIGPEAPGAIECLKWLQSLGAQLILLTMRGGSHLQEAAQWLYERGIEPYDVNHNPHQTCWTDSQKVYAHIYIDDASLGCPLTENPKPYGRPYVDWKQVTDILVKRIDAHDDGDGW